MMSFLHAYFAKQSGLTPVSSYSLVDHVKAATANWSGGGGGGGLDAEGVRDVVEAQLQQGTNVTLVKDDAANIITISATGGGGGEPGVTDHGDLTGLSDDDHPQYRQKLGTNTQVYVRDASGVETGVTYSNGATNNTIPLRAAGGALRVGTASAASDAVPFDQMNTALAAKAATVHGHAISDVTSLQTALDAKAPLASPTFTGTVSGITKAMVGLPNAQDTSDANKPVSTATQTALNGKSNTGHTHTAANITDLDAGVALAMAKQSTRFSADTPTIGATASNKALGVRTITSATLEAGSAPVGSNFVVEVQHWNGTAWSTVTTLTITTGTSVPTSGVIEVASAALSQAQVAGNRVRLNVTSVGSTTPARDVVVEVFYA